MSRLDLDGFSDAFTIANRQDLNNIELFDSAAVGPVILRGSYDISRYPGVTVGAVDAATRIANGVALQAALDYCTANGKIAEIPEARYEYTATGAQEGRNVGLQVKAGSRGLIGGGAGYTSLINFATNHPALTLGDVGGTTSAYVFHGNFRGFAAGHGVTQAGQTSADGILFGRADLCTYDDIKADPTLSGGNFPPYVGFRFGQNAVVTMFSCTFGTMFARSGQLSLVEINAGGTGNAIANMYLGGGSFGSRVALSGPALNLASFANEFGAIQQLNMEWLDLANVLIRNYGNEMVINKMHLEGLKFNGFGPTAFYAIGGRIKIGALKTVDCWIASPAVTGDSVNLVTGYGDYAVDIDMLEMLWNGSGYNAEAVATQPIRIHNDGGSPIDARPQVRIRNIKASGQGAAIDYDTKLTEALAGGRMFNAGEYRYSRALPYTDSSHIAMPSGAAAVTVYGAHRYQKITLNTVIAADRKLILSDKLAATGIGSAETRQVGDIVEVYRAAAATGAFNLNVRNPADSATVFALGTVDTSKFFIWTGSAWTAY